MSPSWLLATATFLPTVESLQSRGLGVRVEFVELDPYFDLLSR
jgi:hypothetical protein